MDNQTFVYIVQQERVHGKCRLKLFGGVGWVDIYYRIAGKFGRELNLVVWRSACATAKLKSANISYSHIYVWQSHTEPPNKNPPILLQQQFGAQPPNLIPANTSRYTVYQLHSTSCIQVLWSFTNMWADYEMLNFSTLRLSAKHRVHAWMHAQSYVHCT